MSEQNIKSIQLAELRQDGLTIQFAEQIRQMLPGGQKLTANEAMSLAVYSRAHGLDPFNGECYFLVQEKDGKRTKTLGLYPGIKGLRKKAKDGLRAIEPQATYRINYEPVDPETLGLNKANVFLAYKASLRDSISEAAYLGSMIKLMTALQGIDGRDKIAREMLGPMPVWEGYGWVNKSELPYIKMSPVNLAKKRAEADVTKQRFDLPFDQVAGVDVGADIVSDEEKPAEGNGNGKAAYRPAEVVIAELYGEPVPEPAQAQSEPVVIDAIDITPEPNAAPFAAFDLEATAAPDQAFWSLQRHIKYNQGDAKELLKAVNGDFKQAYDQLRKIAETPARAAAEQPETGA